MSSSGSNNDARNSQLKSKFQSTSLDIWSLYKQSLRAVETSYLRGREEAFDEVMKYLVMLNKNCDFRYIPISEFISYLEARYQAHREECSTLNRKSDQ